MPNLSDTLCYLPDLPLWLEVCFQTLWVLDLPDFVWSLWFLRPEWNFLNHLITVLWTSLPSPFVQQMFLVASVTLSSHSYVTCSFVQFSNHSRNKAMHNMSNYHDATNHNSAQSAREAVEYTDCISLER